MNTTYTTADGQIDESQITITIRTDPDMTDGWSSDEADRVDHDASARKFLAQCQERIHGSYPDAKVETELVPQVCATATGISVRIGTEPADLVMAAGEYNGIIGHLEHLCTEVYGAQDWVVENPA